MKDKILLILDLDETLIHATSKEVSFNIEPDFRVYQYSIYKRPYLDEFLKGCAEIFDLAVWSSASDDYVKAIVKNIFPADIDLKFVWGRTRCTPRLRMKPDEMYFDSFAHYNYTKQFKKVRNKGYDLARVLIVDDTPSKVVNSYGNAIYSKEFLGDPLDNELPLLLLYLATLKDVSNVRNIEKRYWREKIDSNHLY